MLRQTLFVAGLIGLGIVLWMGLSRSAIGQVGKTTAPNAAPYVHAVIFHVKKDAPEGEVSALIRDAHELLRPIPSVRELRVGRPAEKSTPNVARKDFQVGLLVLFDDAQGLETYLNHPQHQKYVDKHMSHIEAEKLSVFDFVNQTK
ncbi:MAG TPA: Dabb family protein [Gemmataceae bacterium]|nr:Dabb family protein [Gemmataceae bacterium]